MEGMVIMSNEIVYSVVVPLYNEEAVIDESYKRLKTVMDSTLQTYEILFINDGSHDNTSDMVENMCRKDKSIKLINFSRKFGHQAAITAGMNESLGDAVIVIDVDLNDPPEAIIDMIKKWKNGFDVVYGKRVQRARKTFLKKFTARAFYKILRSMTNIDIPVDPYDFRLIDRKVCDALNLLPEKNRPLYLISSKVTYNELRNSAIFKGNRSSAIYDLKVISKDKAVNN